MFDAIVKFFKSLPRNFKILLVHGIFVGGGRQGVAHSLTRQYRSLYIVALGATKIQFGLIQSLQQAARLVLSAPLGQAVDRIRLKRALFVGMLLEFLSVLMYALAFNWYMVIPAVLLVSASWPIRGTVRSIFLASSLDDANRASGFSVYQTISAIPSIFIPFLAAYIVSSFGGISVEGIRPLYLLQFLFLAPASLWVYSKLQEPKRSQSEQKIGLLTSLKKFLVVEKGPRTWILAYALDAFGMLAFMFQMVFAVEVKGATPSILALMGMASTLASILLTVPFGRLADKVGRKPALYVGLIPTFAFILLLVLCPSPEWLILVGVLEGAWTANFPIWRTITMELIPEHMRGSYIGIQGMISGISRMIASTVGGLLWETVSPYAIFLVALAFETTAILLTIPIPETLKTHRKPNARANNNVTN